MYDACKCMIPRQEEELNMDLFKIILAKARKVKRVRNMRNDIKSIGAGEIDKIKSNESILNNNLVIIGSSMQGNERISRIDYMIKQMLDEWGIRNRIIFCGGGLTACAMREEEKPDQKVITEYDDINYTCISCNFKKELEIKGTKWEGNDGVQHLDYTSSFNRHTANTNEHEELTSQRLYKGITIHEHAKSSTIRYLGRPLKEAEEINDKRIKDIYIEYWKSACAVVDQWEQLIKNLKPTQIIINHGLYVPQGIILEVAKKHKVAVSTWHLGYRKNTLLIANEDTYHKTLIEPLDNDYLNEPLPKDEEDILRKYMRSRRTGKNDQISFVYKKGKSNNRLLQNLKAQTKGKINFLVPTNVSWDAQSHFTMNSYSSMEEWIDEIIKIATEYEKSANFIFRCHPAEVTGRRKSRHSSSQYIYKRIKGKDNVFIIKPDELISTYELIDYCDAGIIYASKVGIEIAYAGKELVVCGEACIKCKGIARDVYEKKDLDKHLEDIMSGNKQMDKKRATKYAYHIFFREMIDWARLESTDNKQDDMAVINRLMSTSRS